ncbi:hypothetical protein ACFQ1S_12180 [Kibdelosporangium lantanae]|uniref:Uncharacterized protein n=1 Tax=Kibdelosporangium lantanae TaxID=1497396 RepID=A0ABW3M9N0_9PSEU
MAAPGMGHHQFSAGALLLAGGGSAEERAALTDRALVAAGNSLQVAYNTKPLYDQGIDGTGTT